MMTWRPVSRDETAGKTDKDGYVYASAKQPITTLVLWDYDLGRPIWAIDLPEIPSRSVTALWRSRRTRRPTS